MPECGPAVRSWALRAPYPPHGRLLFLFFEVPIVLEQTGCSIFPSMRITPLKQQEGYYDLRGKCYTPTRGRSIAFRSASVKGESLDNAD
jgi:hypothetical protein